MKLRRRLIEVRTARRRVVDARRDLDRCKARMWRRVSTHPLASVAVAGGSGLVAGYLTGGGRRGRGVLALWSDPGLRWLLRLLGPLA